MTTLGLRRFTVLGLCFGALSACGSAATSSSSPIGPSGDTASAEASSGANDTPAEPSVPAAALVSATVAPPAPVSAPVALAPPPKKGTVVLHVGDSFVHSGLTQRLRTHLEPLGVRYEVRAEHSTNSLDWSKRVPGEVSAAQPDLVIITLGGNEIGSKHLDVQARAIRRIVDSIGGRPCVWTTPPLWMEESGLFDVLQANVSPCRFFETDAVVGSFIPRRADKIHPTAEGGAVWADKLFAWVMAERTGDAKRPWDLKPSPKDELTPRGKRGPLPKP